VISSEFVSSPERFAVDDYFIRSLASIFLRQKKLEEGKPGKPGLPSFRSKTSRLRSGFDG